MLDMFVARTTSSSEARLVEVLVGGFSDLKFHPNRNSSFVSRASEHTEARLILHALVNSPVLHERIPGLIFVFYPRILRDYQQRQDVVYGIDLRNQHSGPGILRNVQQHQ
jgi:hypothetical protein